MPNIYIQNNATNTSGTVGIVSSVLLNPNESRQSATITNDGVRAVYLAFGSTATTNQGIRLNASGGAYEINMHNMYTGTVAAITTTGTVSCCIMEK